MDGKHHLRLINPVAIGGIFMDIRYYFTGTRRISQLSTGVWKILFVMKPMVEKPATKVNLFTN